MTFGSLFSNHVISTGFAGSDDEEDGESSWEFSSPGDACVWAKGGTGGDGAGLVNEWTGRDTGRELERPDGLLAESGEITGGDKSLDAIRA